MGLYKFIRIDHFTSYLIWHINESEDFFIKNLNLLETEHLELLRIRNKKERLGWLAERIALQELFSMEKYPYNGLIKKGKKHYVNGLDLCVSISNNLVFAIACLDKERPIGIDITTFDPGIIKKARRFLNRKEKDFFFDNIELMTLFSSTKKAVFRAYQEDFLSLKDDITIEETPKEKIGIIRGTIHHQPFIAKHKLETYYVISWCRKLLRMW